MLTTRHNDFLATAAARLLQRLFTSRTEVLLAASDSDPLLTELRTERPDLLSDYIQKVAPAAQHAATLKEELSQARSEYRSALETYAHALAVIQAQHPRLVGELKGGLPLIGSRLALCKPFLLVDTFLNRYVVRGQQYKLLLLTSAGLGILNWLSFMQIIGINLNRPTLSALFVAPLGFAFSAAAMVAVKVGLSSFIRATRSYRVTSEREIHQVLFPHGYKDSAVYLSILIVVVDSLFSSIGLLSALPPGVRGEVLWQLATLAVSAFASLCNTILAWGLCLEDIFYSLRLKEESAQEGSKVESLESEICQVQTAKATASYLRQEIRRLERVYRRAARHAVTEYETWRSLVAHYYEERKQEHIKAGNGVMKGDFIEGYQER